MQLLAIDDKLFEIVNKMHEMDKETLPLANSVPLPPSRRMSINQIDQFELKDEQLLQKAEQMEQQLQKTVQKLQEEA